MLRATRLSARKEGEAVKRRAPHRLRREGGHNSRHARPRDGHHHRLPFPEMQAVRLARLLLQHPVQRARHLRGGEEATANQRLLLHGEGTSRLPSRGARVLRRGATPCPNRTQSYVASWHIV